MSKDGITRIRFEDWSCTITTGLPFKPVPLVYSAPDQLQKSMTEKSPFAKYFDDALHRHVDFRDRELANMIQKKVEDGRHGRGGSARLFHGLKPAASVNHAFIDVIGDQRFCTQCGDYERAIQLQYRMCQPDLHHMNNPQGLGPKGAVKLVKARDGRELIFIMRELWHHLDLEPASYKGPLWPESDEIVPLSSPYHPEALMFERIRSNRRRDQEKLRIFDAHMDKLELEDARTALLAPAMAIPLFHEEPIHKRLMPYRV